jgi:hypothetical protein
VVAFVPHTCDEFPLRPQFVRGSSTLLVRLEKLPPLECGVPQTRVKYTQQMDSGGRVPAKLVNKFAVAQLSPLCNMHGRLDQSEKIDGDKRLEFEEMIRAHNQPYTEEELKIVENGLALYKMFEGKKGKAVNLPYSHETAKIALKREDSHAYGWTSATVRAR